MNKKYNYERLKENLTTEFYEIWKSKEAVKKDAMNSKISNLIFVNFRMKISGDNFQFPL